MSNTSSHPFDQAVALELVEGGRLRGQTSERYWNMVSPFGGVTAATALQGVLCRSERQGDPVALTVNFAAPLQPGEFFVQSRLTRANRSTQHWSVEIVQGAAREVMVSAIAVLGTRRSTWSQTEIAPPQTASPEESTRFNPMTKMRWPAMYDVRYARGTVREDNTDSITHSWIRDAEPRALDFLSLTSFCDTFMPRIFLRRPVFTPIGTVSLNIYFHALAADFAEHGEAPVLGVAHGQVCYNGFFDQQGQVWGRNGKLFATTQQIVWYKE